MSERIATIQRDTLETRIQVSVNLDGAGNAQLASGLPFSITCSIRLPVMV